MMICAGRFNIYLLLVLAFALTSGCQTAESKRKKQLAMLRVHVESTHVVPDRTKSVPVYRENPVNINVDRMPMLTEENIARAEVVDVPGGFAIRVQFDHSGSLLLEEVSGSNNGKRLVLFCHFVPDPKKKETVARWLAAPKITRRISDGSLQFTPDASREETDIIVLGLNNAARKYQDKPSTL